MHKSKDSSIVSEHKRGFGINRVFNFFRRKVLISRRGTEYAKIHLIVLH